MNAASRYVALLRGINVGGNNLIKMADLKTCFEKHGFTEVTTYIQSGNVVFEAPKQDVARLTQTVEAMLAKTFGYQARALVCSREQLEAVVVKAPKGFGAKPKDYRYNVLFLIPPLTAAEALKNTPLRQDVDQVWAGPGVLYHSRVEAFATKSRLNLIVAMPMYKNITIRNWNTTTKLCNLMEQTK